MRRNVMEAWRKDIIMVNSHSEDPMDNLVTVSKKALNQLKEAKMKKTLNVIKANFYFIWPTDLNDGLKVAKSIKYITFILC